MMFKLEHDDEGGAQELVRAGAGCFRSSEGFSQVIPEVGDSPA
jgi:hypothetical protein